MNRKPIGLSVPHRAPGATPTDTERLDWLQDEIRKNTVAEFKRHGQAWVRLFTVTSQHTPNKETIREVIDCAMGVKP